MSYPTILPEEATSENIKALLDAGKHFFLPMPVGYQLPVFKDKEAGKYILSVNQMGGEMVEFEGTEEGLKQLAFFLAFCGIEYV